MPSQEQLKNLKKVVVKYLEPFPNKIDIYMVFIDHLGRHDHVVTWNKSDQTIHELVKGLWCTCTSCSNYNLLYKRPCIFKLRAIEYLVEKGKLSSDLLDIIYLVSVE